MILSPNQAHEIKTLRAKMARKGDLSMWSICVLALKGPEAIAGGDPGSEYALLAGKSQEWAIAECTQAIAAGEAEAVAAERARIAQLNIGKGC
jgi:hypothetical protein